MAAKLNLSKDAREQQLLEVGKLSRRGYSSYKIAERLGVSQAQVAYDLKIVRERYKEAGIRDRVEQIEEMAQAYHDAMLQLWQAWERSMEDAKKLVEEKGLAAVAEEEEPKLKEHARLPSPKYTMQKIKEVLTTTGRLPSAEYMRLILECRKALRELYGLDAPKQLTLGLAEKIPWEMLHDEAEAEVLDTVEAKITEGLPTLPPPKRSETNGKH